MSDGIKVSVCSYGPGRNLALRYTDPATGRRVAKSAGTTNRREAERRAAVLEKELREGTFAPPSKTTWDNFTTRYTDEALPGLAERTGELVQTVFAKVACTLRPKRLADVTAARLSYLAAEWRRQGLAEETIRCYSATLRSTFRWAHDVGMLATMPKFPKLQRVKRGDLMKGRPVEPPEFHKMMLAVPDVVGEAAAPSWIRYLRGLWWSGLRLRESLELTWNEPDKWRVDLSGKYPMLRIPGKLQKNGRDQLYPVAPEFGEMLLATPEAERHGPVFRLQRIVNPKGGPTGAGLVNTLDWVSRVVCRIGKAADVVVNITRKRDRKTGKPREVKKYASAHDLRRSFAFRWSRRVMPPELRELMRHGDVATTMQYYVGQNAETTAGALWRAYEAESCPDGNIRGNNQENGADDKEGEKPQTPEKQGLSE